MRLPVLAALLSGSAVGWAFRPQAGSPIAPNFHPAQNSLSSAAFRIQQDAFGRGGSCGSRTLEVCSRDPTQCCELGGTCCGGGRCCPGGKTCQVNILGDVVCCARGESCFSVIKPRSPQAVPCSDRTAVPCANFTFCCPANNLCSVVSGRNVCTPNVSSLSSNVSVTVPSSSSSRTPTRSSSTLTVTTPMVTVPTQSPVTVVVTVTPPTVTPPTVTATAPPTVPVPDTTPPPTPPTPDAPTEAPPTAEQPTTSIVTSVVSTIVEITTVISSVEVSSGVFSTIDVVLSSTRVFTTLATIDPTGVSPPADTGTSDTSPPSAPSAAVLAGASIAGTVFLAAIGFLIFYCARRGRTRRRPHSLDFPPPIREPTVPVLLHNPNDRYRDVPMSPVVPELSPTTSPAPRYSAMYAPPPPPPPPPPPAGVVEMQDHQVYPQDPAGGKYKHHQPPAGAVEMQGRQVYSHDPSGGGKYEQQQHHHHHHHHHPPTSPITTSYELPATQQEQQQQPFIDPRTHGHGHGHGQGQGQGQGQGYGQDIGRGY